MTINLLMSLSLRPTQKRQIRGMIATLVLVRDYGYGPNVTIGARGVLAELTKSILPDATFDSIVAAKYLLNDFTGCVCLTDQNNLANCLAFIGDTLQNVFDHYINLADCRGL